jgi:hypothetical protein
MTRQAHNKGNESLHIYDPIKENQNDLETFVAINTLKRSPSAPKSMK